MILFGGTRSGPELPRPEPQIRAASREQLVAELGSASAGDTVYVPPGETIDLSGRWMLEVPDGVTLASSRRPGGPDGARLKSTPGDESPTDGGGVQKITLGTGARFTGFRLEGHHHEYANPEVAYDGNYEAHMNSGIRAGRNAIVDNNDISGWVHSGVWAEDDALVRDNDVHHHAWEGYGYGVYVPAGDHMPLVEYNRFNYNRHSIAAGGGPAVGYAARHNLVGPDWLGHQFDVHGDEDDVAGDRILVEGNVFEATRAVEAKTRDPGGKYPAVRVRGTPVEGVRVQGNVFEHANRDSAYEQQTGPHRVHFANNVYGWPDDE